MSDLANRPADVAGERRAEFRELLQAELSAAPQAGPTRRRRTGPAPLSFAQETLWFLDRLAPGRPTYNVVNCFRLHGELDADALRQAFAQIVARHQSLRTYFAEDGDTPVQIVVPEVAVELPVTAVADEQEALRLGEETVQQPFDLESPPLWRLRLLRIGPADHLFVCVVHHIVFDGWSLAAFAREVGELYRASVAGGEPALPELPIQYPDYAEWQRELLQGEPVDRLRRYWRGQLDGVPVVDVPTDRPRPSVVTFDGTFTQRVLPSEVVERVAAFARDGNVTVYVVYLAAFFALLHRSTAQDDLVVGSPMVNRGYSEIEPLIGFFANVLALRVDASGDPSFRELVLRTRDVVLDALQHSELPFGKVVEAVRPRRDPSRSPLFQIAYTFQNASGDPISLPGVEVSRLLLDSGTSRFDMSWTVTEAPDGLEVAVEFNTRLFDRETIEQLLSHYEQLLRSATADPAAALSRIHFLSERERHALVHRWQGPRREVAETTVDALFARQAARTPDAVALVVAGRERTYAEVDRDANRLAHALRATGAAPERIVGILLPRGADLVTAVLGTLKSGAAYLPLDPAHPPARLAEIVEDAEPVAIVTTTELAERLAPGPPLVVLDEGVLARSPDTAPPPAARPDSLAYVLYTSGSTGKPKGVLVEHRSVVNFVRSVQELFSLTADDRVLGFAALTFDVSVFELFSAFSTGARLYLATDEERLSTEQLQALMEEAAITVIDLPPSVMALLEPERFEALRIVFVGGEAFPGELVARWGRGRRFFNGYGPTECTVTMIVEECRGRFDASPPIGLPMANHVAYVLDRNLEPVPAGVHGELVIGGAGLARGYLRREESTRRKFLPDPFGLAPGGRVYRTGDVVKRLRDGRLVFAGRLDRQVKIRGIRIELGEIEAELAAHPDVAQTVVEQWTDERGEKHLVAWVVPEGGRELDPMALRSHLAERLPTAMLPGYVVPLSELPLTSSGKLARDRLPPPETARPVREPAPPRTETERLVVEELFAHVLGRDRIGVHDNFFELGGNSLQAAQLVSRARRRFELAISLVDFFRTPTPAHLARLVETAPPTA
jgi:amino acid adenylation domain-containing protein